MDNPMLENATNTVLYATTTMKYFEKHKIMEILAKLFLELELDRPVDAIDYIAKNLRNIANEILYTKARVSIPNNLSKDEFIKSFNDDYNIPTIVFEPKKQYSTSKILQKTKKFLKQKDLNKKHKIFLNYPKKCEDSREFLDNDLSPSAVVEFNLEGDCCMDPSLRDYYGRLHHRLCLRIKNSSPSTDAMQNINEAMTRLINIIRTTKMPPTPYLRGCYYPRVLIIGRTGSGRRTQANYLASRFNLTKINYKEIISEEIASKSPMGEALKLRPSNDVKTSSKLTFGIIYKRILQNDCLRNGWVLHSFPNKLEDLQHFYEASSIQPNKIFFLHCRRKLAFHRMEKKLFKVRSIIEVEEDMKLLNCLGQSFDAEKDKILKFLQSKSEVFHINGNHRASVVRDEILDKFAKDRHSIGFF
ncbi:hypothetical protein ACFFRR_001431 [Megaselia abdita]